MIRAEENRIGAQAFFIGVIISLLIGVLSRFPIINKNFPLMMGILAILGVVVGSFVAQKDVQTFLLASVSVVVASYMGAQGLLTSAAMVSVYAGKTVTYVMQSFLALFVPATIIVALKTVFAISKS